MALLSVVPRRLARLVPPTPLPGKRPSGRSRAGNHTHPGPPDERPDPTAARAAARPPRDRGRPRGELKEARGIFPVGVRALSGEPGGHGADSRPPREAL